MLAIVKQVRCLAFADKWQNGGSPRVRAKAGTGTRGVVNTRTNFGGDRSAGTHRPLAAAVDQLDFEWWHVGKAQLSTG
jgi:hypothetical protein